MSRSILKDKYMRRCYTGRSFKSSKWDDPVRNPHRQDEMPKNSPSRLVLIHCPAVKVKWLQSPSNRGTLVQKAAIAWLAAWYEQA